MPVNEAVLSYAPGSAERELLRSVLEKLKNEEADIPMYIGSKEVRTNKKERIHPPHELKPVSYTHLTLPTICSV